MKEMYVASFFRYTGDWDRDNSEPYFDTIIPTSDRNEAYYAAKKYGDNSGLHKLLGVYCLKIECEEIKNGELGISKSRLEELTKKMYKPENSFRIWRIKK